MKLQIAPAKLLRELQAEFNNVYPYLRIEFLRKNSHEKSGTLAGDLESRPDRKVGDCQSRITDGIVEITGDITVSELEKMLKEQFHLNIRVFRKSGNTWLQTTMTDDWTLQKQNEHGKEISRLSETG